MAATVHPLMPSSSLACQSFEFMPLWDKSIKPGCLSILQNPFSGIDTTPLFTAVYRLATNPCTKVPVLVRGSQNEKVETRDLPAQQCLVLYYLLRELLKEHADKVIMKPDGQIKKTVASPEFKAHLACVYVEEWWKFAESIRRLKSVFNYLQNHWHTLHMHNTNIFFDVTAMGMNMWYDHVLAPHRKELSEVMLGLYFDSLGPIPFDVNDEDGENKTPNQCLLKDVIGALVELDQHISHSSYSSLFDHPLRESIARRFKQDSSRFFKPANLAESLQDIKSALMAEEERISKTGQPATVTNVRMAILDQILTGGQRLEAFLNVAMNEWLSSPTGGDSLSLLHSLLQHSSSGLKQLRERFVSQVFICGCDELKQQVAEALASGAGNVDVLFVESVVSVCARLQTVVNRAFGDDVEMRKAFEEGCRRLANKNDYWMRNFGDGVSPLARYLHFRLVNGEVTLSDRGASGANTSTEHTSKTVDQVTQMVLQLYSYSDKGDEFLEQYHRDFSSRILYFANFNVDVERAILAKIGRVAGSREFAHRFEMMLKDYVESKGTNRTFYITAGSYFWPWGKSLSAASIKGYLDLNGSVPLVLPTPAEKRIVNTWMPSLSWAQIQTNPKYYNKRVIDVTLSHLQMAILLQFQSPSVATRSFGVIADAFLDNAVMPNAHYGRGDVASAIVSLVSNGLLMADAQATADVLMARGGSFELNVGYNPSQNVVDFFTIDALFPETERAQIIRVVSGQTLSVVGKSAVGAGSPGTAAAISDNTRIALIEAHIIKAVKSTEKISHAELTSKVDLSLDGRFKPSRDEIKTVIEKLLEKEFLERDPSELGCYRYVA